MHGGEGCCLHAYRRMVVIFLLLASALAAPQDCASLPPTAFEPLSLRNANGLELVLLPYGGTAQALRVPQHSGEPPLDVLLGFDDPRDYCTGGVTSQHPYFGALIGRVANRIARCSFSLGASTYHTPCNEFQPATGLNDTLHGGTIGYDRRVWTVANRVGRTSVELTLDSPNGEMGFPSELAISVTHTLRDGTGPGAHGAWDLQWKITNVGSLPTPVAPTMHAYFMLSGFKGEDTVLPHVLQMANATRYEVVDAGLIPTGELVDVTKEQRWMDFTAPKALGRDFPLPSGAAGYDNAWLFAGGGGAFLPQADLFAPASGVRMVTLTDAPSVQVYTGNFLNATGPTQVMKKRSQRFSGQGLYYQQHSAITFEAQEYIGVRDAVAARASRRAPRAQRFL